MKFLFHWLRYAWRFMRLFRALGVPVHFHTTTLVWPCGIIFWLGWSDSGTRGLIEAFFCLTVLYGSLLIHEFAHVLTARHYGCPTRRILLLPFGCIADLEAIPREPEEIWVALAGPVASLALAGLVSLSLAVFRGWLACSQFTVVAIFDIALDINLIIGLFNLLPCFPMDGGRVLRSLLAILIGLFLPRRASKAFLLATRVAVRYVARPIALGMVVLTIAQTHFWIHVFLFGFLIVAGEVEFLLLRESPRFSPVPVELALLPATRSVSNASQLCRSEVNPWTVLERTCLRMENIC